MIIAVDGPAASGKGTLAALLAAHYGLPHLDTGLLYRAVGKVWAPFADGPGAEEKAIEIAQSLDGSKIDPTELGSAEAGQAASKVSVIPGVRAALFALQHDFARQAGGAVLDGRDIGTVICPDADVKLYVTADAGVRAERRAQQLEARGQVVDRTWLRADIEARDRRDMGRATAPLRPADDAYLLDTSEMAIEAALRAAIAIVDRAIGRKAEH